MLKLNNYNNVICFTYGRKGNPEMVISKKVARALNYKWIFVEYTNSLINNFISDLIFSDYYRSMSNYSSLFFMQEYFAVKYLKENNLIPKNSIFVPGHSGDFIGGSQLNKYANKNTPVNKLPNDIYRKKYLMQKPPDKYRKFFTKKIEHFVFSKENTEHENLSYSIFENWDFKEKIAKTIFNSARVYCFFDYESRFPFWDNELVDLSKHLPFEVKVYKMLYDDVLKNCFFEPCKVNFEQELQSNKTDYIKYRIKSRVKKYLPARFKEKFIRKNDTLCYYEISRILIKDMQQKNFKYWETYNSYNEILAQWYISKIAI